MNKIRKLVFVLIVLLVGAGLVFAFSATDDATITGAWKFTKPPQIFTDILYGTQTYKGMPQVLVQDFTAYTATNGTTATVPFRIRPAMLDAGKSLRITIAGTITGANAAKGIRLYIDNAEICALNTASGDAGAYMAQFILSEHTDWAHQLTWGKAEINGVAPIVVTANDTTNLRTGQALIKVNIVSAHGSDTITATMGIVELLP